jgi:outer membrane protein assembly factor BamE
MRKLIIACLSLNFILLTGCGLQLIRPYQPDIQQGNVISEQMAESVRPGMSKEQVRNNLGTPVLVNAFDDNHWGYAYTFQHNGREIIRKNIDVYFQNGRVSRVVKDAGKIPNK